jgi:hypothetical protein
MEPMTLQQFYDRMHDTWRVRRELVTAVLHQDEPSSAHIDLLRDTLQTFEDLVDDDNTMPARIDAQREISLNIDYEVQELRKDMVFLQQGEEALYAYLEEIQPGLTDEVHEKIRACNARGYTSFVSDRDGTVNNYCGRYLSSVQSVYNAVFLTRFARHSLRHGVILTSAPLDKGGMVDVATTPQDAYVLAGSKGREYYDTRGQRGALRIPPDQQEKLDALNRAIEALLADPDNEKFGLIGSGFQKKFGQSTIAHQDITGSIPEAQSRAFSEKIGDIVTRIDPDNAFFRIEDTGMDLEIILTVEDGSGRGGLKDFSKADGIAFLDERLGLELDAGSNLICGDTSSDIPMIELGMQRNRDTHAIFVTQDAHLQRNVAAVCPHALFVSCPDVLVCMCNELARLRGAKH